MPEIRLTPRSTSTRAEYVIVPTRMRGRPRASDAEVALDEVYVSKIYDGDVVEVREYSTREQAFGALGLDE